MGFYPASRVHVRKVMSWDDGFLGARASPPAQSLSQLRPSPPLGSTGNGAMALLRPGRCCSRRQGGCLQHLTEAQRRPKGQDAGGTPTLPGNAVPAGAVGGVWRANSQKADLHPGKPASKTVSNFGKILLQSGNCLPDLIAPQGLLVSGRRVQAMKLLSLLLPLFIATLAVFGQPEDKAGKKPHPPKPGSGSRAELDEVTSRVTAGLAGPEHSLPVHRNNYIDDFILDKLERDGIPHAPLSSDAEFLRRAHLDLTGRLPEVAKARSFLKDTDPDKRSRLIDELTGAKVDPAAADHPSHPYLDRWTYFLCRSLSRHPGRDRPQGTESLLGLSQHGAVAGRSLRPVGHRDADGHGPLQLGVGARQLSGQVPRRRCRRAGGQPRGQHRGHRHQHHPELPGDQPGVHRLSRRRPPPGKDQPLAQPEKAGRSSGAKPPFSGAYGCCAALESARNFPCGKTPTAMTWSTPASSACSAIRRKPPPPFCLSGEGGRAGGGPSPGLRPHAHLPPPVCPGHRQPDLGGADGCRHRRSALRVRPGPAGPGQSSSVSLDHSAHPSGVAGRPGERLRRERLQLAGHHPPHRQIEHLPALQPVFRPVALPICQLFRPAQRPAPLSGATP